MRPLSLHLLQRRTQSHGGEFFGADFQKKILGHGFWGPLEKRNAARAKGRERTKRIGPFQTLAGMEPAAICKGRTKKASEQVQAFSSLERSLRSG